MSHLIYILIGVLIGVVMTGLYLTDLYKKKVQKGEILYVINKVKRLKRSKKIPVIKKTIRIFACRCVRFDPESFRAFPGKEFENIARAIGLYATQNYPNVFYGNTEVSYPILQIEYVTEAQTKQAICENLEKAFGV